MFGFFGAHYRELVIITMTLFAVTLFFVSVADLKYNANANKRD